MSQIGAEIGKIGAQIGQCGAQRGKLWAQMGQLKTDYLIECPKELVGSNFFFEKKKFFLKISM